MFNLKKEIDNWKKLLRKSRVFEVGYIEELEQHLREEIDKNLKAGLNEKEAFDKSVVKIGDVESLSSEYYKSDTTNKISGRPSWKSPKWMPELFWSYFKSASRNLKRNIGFAAINILGLAVSIACILVILFYVINELSYEDSFKNNDSIYRIVNTRKLGDIVDKSARNPVPFGPSLKSNIPEIRESARFWRGYLPVIGKGTKFYDDVNIYFADKSALNIFNFDFISGNPVSALDNPSTVVLTESLAKKLFGEVNPVGQSIIYKGYPSGEVELTVTGLIKDLPANTHLEFDALISLTGIDTEQDNWKSFKPIWVYAMLTPNADLNALSKKIDNYTNEYFAEEGIKISYAFEKIKNIHLYSKYRGGFKAPGSITNVYLFSAIGILILLIGCANFVNLSTSRTMTRAREVGIRKVLGAEKKQLVYQFQIESLVIFGISALIGLALFSGIKPFVSNITGLDYNLNFLLRDGIIIYLILFGLLISILSATYPSITLSAFNPVKALKQKIFSGKEGNSLRYALVIFQFVVTIFLITSAVILNQQLSYVFNKKLGFNKNNVVVIPYGQNYDAFKNTLLNNSSINSIAVSKRVPVNNEGYDSRIIKKEGSGDEVSVENYVIDKGFLETYGMELIAGRNLRYDSKSEKKSFLINETAVKKLGFSTPEEAIGQTINWSGGLKVNVVGVVKDFFTTSFHEKIPPVALHKDYTQDFWKNFISLKINSNNINETLETIRNTWKEFNPKNAYSSFFIDESLAKLHIEDEKFRDAFNYLSLLAIFVACLGLFGLISFLTEKRKKEIGIRKVFGSSVLGIVLLLLKNIFISLVISAGIAVPLTYVLNQKWLSDFSYRISINAEMFVISFVIVVFIALMTTGYRVLRAAFSNPVDSLKYE